MLLSRLSFRRSSTKLSPFSSFWVEQLQQQRKMSHDKTSLIDNLIKEHPTIKVGDKEAVDSKIANILSGGHEKLQLVVDFDNTLTRHHKDGKIIDNSWGVMENSPLLPKDYTQKTNSLRAKYLPIETDHQLSVEDKIPHMEAWYKQANELLQETGIKKDMFAQFVRSSNIDFRDHTKVMLDSLQKAQVPVLVMSAGLGDILVEVMETFQILHQSNTKVVSNFLSYDENGKVIGLEGKMIHVYNKNENAFQDSEYFKVLNGRGNVILLGDSIGDLRMADGVENPKNILKIGFLNNMGTANERLPSFLEGFDIVLIDDQTMNVPLDIMRKIKGIDIVET